MADETADVVNIEQLVICIIWVDGQLNAYKEVICFHPIPDTTANTIALALKVLKFLNYLTKLIMN